MALLVWHAHLSHNKEGFFIGRVKISMVGRKWFLKISARRNGKHGKTVSRAGKKDCIRRCIKAEGFGTIKEASLNDFSDASKKEKKTLRCNWF